MRIHFETPDWLPVQLRSYDHNGLKFYFGRTDKQGLEDSIELCIKSDHFDLQFAKPNDDKFICPNSQEEFRGKGGVSARKVYANEMLKRANAEARKEIGAATAQVVS